MVPRVAKPRAEYTLSDYPASMARGKYAKRLQDSSNIVVLKPEVAEAFPNAEAVNDALMSLIRIAKACSHASDYPVRRAKARG